LTETLIFFVSRRSVRPSPSFALMVSEFLRKRNAKTYRNASNSNASMKGIFFIARAMSQLQVFLTSTHNVTPMS